LKKKFLDMLEEDKEFRYAVAGAIGYKEILDRIARVEEDMNKRFLELEAEMNKRFLELEERMDERFLELETRVAKVEEEIRDLRAETNALREETNNLREETNRLRQDMLEGFRRHDEEFKRHWESIEKLRQDMLEGFRRHDEEFKRIDKRLRRIEAYMEKTSLTLEEEARDVIEYMLKRKGLTLSISRLELPDIEIDIYGIDTDTCIIGEVKTRASKNMIERVDKDIARLCKKHPEYLRKKVIKAIYAMQITPDALEEAKRRDIWLVTAKGELTELIT
ncbi:MAG: hypothetical protein ACK4FV_06225, partial [Candidatus Nitrosocaldus sp.]